MRQLCARYMRQVCARDAPGMRQVYKIRTFGICARYALAHAGPCFIILECLRFIKNRICAGVCALYIYVFWRKFSEPMRPGMRPIYIYVLRQFQDTPCYAILNYKDRGFAQDLLLFGR